MSACRFCAIGAGDHPAEIVWQDQRLVAFMDAFPIRPGHLQIVPRDHYPAFLDLPADLLAAIGAAGQRLGRGLQAVAQVERIAFAFSGADVAHAHAHVFPLHEAGDMTSRACIEGEFTLRRPQRAPDGALAAMAGQIRHSLKVA